MQNPVTFLRRAGHAEAVSFLFLIFVAVPLKYFAAWPYGVKILGPIHGLFFLAFSWAIWEAKGQRRWNLSFVLPLFLSAFLPFGPFFFEGKLRAEEKTASKGDAS